MHCAAGSDWCRSLRQTFWGRQARPAMALAVTVAGLARWVWLLGPSGPSKFPVELGMHRSSGPIPPHAGRHFAVLEDAGGCLEILEPAVGAESDEGCIDLQSERRSDRAFEPCDRLIEAGKCPKRTPWPTRTIISLELAIRRVCSGALCVLSSPPSGRQRHHRFLALLLSLAYHMVLVERN